MKKVLKTLKALAALGGTALAVVGGISIYHKFFKKEEDLEDAFDDEELFEEEDEDDVDTFDEEEIFEEEPAPASDADEASVKETEPEEPVSSEDAEEAQKDA